MALLIYLAVEPRVQHRRDRLTTLLWEKAPPSDARHSLATAISMLRGKLGPESFESGRDWIRFAPTELDLDLDRLAREEELPTEILPALDVGGFLENLEIPDSPGFEHWRDAQRALWEPRIRDALVRLMDDCRRTGDFHQIEGFANSLLKMNELSEDGVRAKMEARAFAGDRLTALKIYEAWKARLAEELDAVPAPLLEGMAVRLRNRGLERLNTKEIASVPTDQWRDRPFVGRASEYRELYESWEASYGGSPRHVLVVGDSGVGKSTLLHRLATAAGLEGAVTTRTQGHALEQKVPYAALGTLMEDLIDRPGAACTEPGALAELAKIVVRVGERFPDLPVATEAHGEAARFRLADSVERLLVNIAEEQPVILIVDDLHHSDDASIAVLHLLMRRLKTQRVMVLLAASTAALAEIPSARKLIDGCEHVGLQVVALGPLSHTESETLLDTLVPTGEVGPAGTARQALLRAGAGFPMALELLVRDWLAYGEQGLALTLEAMTENVGVAGPFHAYRQMFDRLHERLDPTTRNVLHLAAILGPRLNDPRMYAMADLSLGQTMTGLTRLSELRVLRDTGRQLEFVNEVIRGQAYVAVPSPLRRVIHERVAERLMVDEQEGREVPGLEIAWHLIRGGRSREATGYLLQGARTATLQGAPNEAERALSTAMDGLDASFRGEAVVLLAEALLEQGKARETLDLVVKRQEINEPATSERKQILIMRARFQTHADSDQFFEESLQQVEKLCATSISDARKVDAVYGVLSWAHYRRDYLAIEKIEGFLTWIDGERLDDRNSSRLLLVKALLQLSHGQITTSSSALESALNRLRSSNRSDSMVATAHNGLGIVKASRGHYVEALEHHQEAYRIGLHLRNEGMSSTLCSNIALCLLRLGRFEEHITWANRAYAGIEASRRPFRFVRNRLHLALAQAMLGAPLDALKTAAEASPFLEHLSSTALQASLLLFADVHRVCGNSKDAEEYALGAFHESREIPKQYSGVFARWLAIVGPRLDDKWSRSTLEELHCQRGQLDSLDRAEVTAALASCTSDVPRRTDLEKCLEEELAGLPAGIRDFLTVFQAA